jgi:hypothetical protein
MTDLAFAGTYSAVTGAIGLAGRALATDPRPFDPVAFVIGSGISFGGAYLAATLLWPAHPVWTVVVSIVFGAVGILTVALAGVAVSGTLPT